MWAEAGRCAKGAAPKGKSEEREGGALRQKRRAKGPAPEGKSEERGGRRPFCMLRDVDFPRVHGFPGFGSLPSPRAGPTFGGAEIFLFFENRPQERNPPGGWLTDCCTVNQLFPNFSRGTPGGIGVAKSAGAERGTWGNSFFSAGPRKPSPGANSGDCGGFLSMVQGAWSKGRMKKCSHELFLRMVQGAWSKGHGPRGMVQ